MDAIDSVSCRPDFAVACYSGYLKVKDKDEIRADLRIPAHTPPIFLAHASDDAVEIPREEDGDLGERLVHLDPQDAVLVATTL